MVNRRLILALGGGVAAGALGWSSAARAQPRGGGGIAQGDFLFWMDDAARAQARAAADAMLLMLDGAPPQDPAAARRLHAAGSSELRQRYKVDEFANRVAQTRGALGAVRQRAFQGVDGGFRMLPNLPDGEYCIVLYDLQMDRGGLLATEQFTLARSAGQPWLLANHYVGERPFYRY